MPGAYERGVLQPVSKFWIELSASTRLWRLRFGPARLTASTKTIAEVQEIWVYTSSALNWLGK